MADGTLLVQVLGQVLTPQALLLCLCLVFFDRVHLCYHGGIEMNHSLICTPLFSQRELLFEC